MRRLKRVRPAHGHRLRHCLTTRRVLVRGDGSTAHEGIFDLETGAFLRQSTHQGVSGDSCWSRGLAWALYAFWNRVPLHARSAAAGHGRRLAPAFYIDHRPRWRTAVGLRCAERQPSAGRHLSRRHRASGLLQLAHLVPDRIHGRYYETIGAAHSEHFVQALPGRRRCRVEGILKGGVYHVAKISA